MIRSRRAAWTLAILFACGCADDAPPNAPAETPTAAETPAVSLPAPEATKVAIPLDRRQIDDGWIALFDGKTLFGWQANNDVDWAVQDGTIVASAGEPGLLLTTVPFVDYELHCEYRLEPGGNSGIFLRTVFEPKNPAEDCYELNMCDSHPTHKTGSLVARHAVPTPDAKEGEWHAFDVTVSGKKIVATLDGKPVLDFVDESAHPRDAGFVGLQKNQGKIEFKNVRLKPLGMRPLFDGQTLDGWRTVPGAKGTFAVQDGTIHAAGGPAFLETTETAADFALRLSVRTNGPGLNSGVFFRAEPGTEAAPSNGYELQIHNGFQDGDRSRPADFGSGAIFRRVPARAVVPNDGEWFVATLVAAGPRFATWIDGYQVVDWQDERPADDNPRKGLRLAAGHISLQGHDPTTTVDFRDLKLARYPAATESVATPVP